MKLIRKSAKVYVNNDKFHSLSESVSSKSDKVYLAISTAQSEAEPVVLRFREICVSMRENRNVNKLDGPETTKWWPLNFVPNFVNISAIFLRFTYLFLEKQNIERKN